MKSISHDSQIIMVYVLDTNSIRVVGNYYPERFPSFWEKFNTFISTGKIISVREVYRELDFQATKSALREWIHDHRAIFCVPSQEETQFVSEIFSNNHFQTLLKQRNILTGMPVADPFVIAAAKVRNAYVVSEESKKENAAQIPNICEHYRVNHTNIEGMMEREGWEF